MSDPSFNETSLPLFEGQELIVTGTQRRLQSYIENHRQQLCERLISGSAVVMQDYESLELCCLGRYRAVT